MAKRIAAVNRDSVSSLVTSWAHSMLPHLEIWNCSSKLLKLTAASQSRCWPNAAMVNITDLTESVANFNPTNDSNENLLK